MSNTTDAFCSVSEFDCTPSASTNELTLKIKQGQVADIAYSTQHNAFVVLTDNDIEAIELYVAEYNDALENLNNAREEIQGSSDSSSQKQFAEAQEELRGKLKTLTTGSRASHNQLVWYEMHRLGTDVHEVIYAPGTIINPGDSSRNRKFYFLTGTNEDPDNAFRSMRTSDGTVDSDELKKRFRDTAFKIKADWKLVDDASGQVPSRVLASMASPVLAQLLNDELDALDDWVGQVNAMLNWQSQQYQAERDRALALLTDRDADDDTDSDSPQVTFEEYGEAQLLCRSIWGSESPIESVQYRFFDPSNSDNSRRYEQLIDTVRQKELPPVIWQASAEANLMRWKAGAKAAVDFELQKGVLAAEATAEFDFALAEGKLAGSLFYPNDEGVRARATVHTSTNKLQWREFSGSMPGRLEFGVDSEFLDENAIARLAEAFRHWGLLKTTLNDQYRLAIKGHTSLTGPSGYNAALSLRRAQMVFAFLTRNVGIWSAMFKLPLHSGTSQTYWGQEEESYMRTTLLKATEYRHFWSMFESADRETLIGYYMDYLHYRYQDQHSGLPRLTLAEFAEQYMIPLGETQPLVPEPGEIRANRRVEFIVLEPGEVEVVEGPKGVDFGCFRLQFKGHVSAWAGVNVGLSAKMDVKMRGGQMTFPEQLGGEGRASGLAGAKVEAGLAASLDWQKPEDQDAATPAKFNALGTAGYLVQGQAGIGGEAEFKIGYDYEIERFVIKAKAAMCVGLGAGGAFEFSIDAKQVWNFIALVHEQLREADFNFVDTFEQDAYDRFCSWSYELIKKGHYFQGVTVRAGIEAANIAIQTLEEVGDVMEAWQEYEETSENLGNLMQYMRNQPDELRYAPPEVKGRILHILLNSPRRFWEDVSLTDWDRERENAIVQLLTTMVSKREYLEVLEHTSAHTIEGRTELQRCDHASSVQAQLLEYVNDGEDREALKAWWASLPDPSQCTCVIPDLSTNNLFD